MKLTDYLSQSLTPRCTSHFLPVNRFQPMTISLYPFRKRYSSCSWSLFICFLRSFYLPHLLRYENMLVLSIQYYASCFHIQYYTSWLSIQCYASWLSIQYYASCFPSNIMQVGFPSNITQVGFPCALRPVLELNTISEMSSHCSPHNSFCMSHLLSQVLLGW